jgi:hypothetical protein
MTPASFDMTTAPNIGEGYFLGDYEGLVAPGESFGAFFAMPSGSDMASIFYRDPLPAGGEEVGSAAPAPVASRARADDPPRPALITPAAERRLATENPTAAQPGASGPVGVSLPAPGSPGVSGNARVAAPVGVWAGTLFAPPTGGVTADEFPVVSSGARSDTTHPATSPEGAATSVVVVSAALAADHSPAVGTAPLGAQESVDGFVTSPPSDPDDGPTFD